MINGSSENQANWKFHQTPINANALHVSVTENGKAFSFRQTIELFQNEPEFNKKLSQQLAACEFRAFRWETPPITRANLARPFEFVLLRYDHLERDVDLNAFAQHFKTKDSVVTFANLSGDSTLIVPTPRDDHSTYVHLASFLRSASFEQINQLWKLTGISLANLIGPKPLWLSTAGMGVAWLHIRIDTRPKYYGYTPYRQMTGTEIEGHTPLA